MSEQLKSLDEIITEAKAQGKNPWDLKLAAPYIEDVYFIPYFSDKHGYWCGLTDDGVVDRYDGSRLRWHHYQETKPKKKYALYAKCVGMQPSVLVFENGKINSEYRPPFFGSYALGLLEESEVTDEYIKIPNTELELEDE